MEKLSREELSRISQLSSHFAKVYPAKHEVEPNTQKSIHANFSGLTIRESLSNKHFSLNFIAKISIQTLQFGSPLMMKKIHKLRAYLSLSILTSFKLTNKPYCKIISVNLIRKVNITFRLTKKRYCKIILVTLIWKVNVLKNRIWIFAKAYRAKLFLIGILRKFIQAKFFDTWPFANVSTQYLKISQNFGLAK